MTSPPIGSPPGRTTSARPRVTVLGSVNMDLIVRAAHLPAPGETLLGHGFASLQGGKGANQAIAAARAGAAVSMIGAVGTDVFGDELAAALSVEGVRTDRLRRVAGPSGIAVITVDDDAENTIVVAPGANGLLIGLTDQDASTIRESNMLLLQLEVPIETVTRAATIAAEEGVLVLLNPSPTGPLSSELLAAVTILAVNEGEAASIGAENLARVPHVVTTLGPAGARYRGPAGGVISVRPPTVAPVDTTGAGDAFAGAFAVAWAQGGEPTEALAWACAAGALATTRHGAGSSAPTRGEIDHLTAKTGA